MDIFAGVKRTTNGYALAGAVNGAFPLPSVLIATDTMGTVTWTRKYADGSFFPLTPLFVSDLQKTNAGGYVMTGTFGSNAMLLKVNGTGGSVFSKKYGKSPNEFGSAVKEMSGGEYVVAGGTQAKSMNTAKDSTSIYVFKTDNSGNYQWGRSYTLTSPVFDSHDAAVDVAEVSNGYVFTGYISDKNGIDTTRNILLFKTDFNGTLQWMESIGAVGDNEEGYSIKVLPSGNLLVAGYTDKTSAMDDIALLETDANGNLVYSTAYGVGLGNFAGSVQTTSSGGYAIIGWTITNVFPLTIKSYLLTLNSSHTPVLCKEYNSTIGGLFSKGEQTPDGGYILGDMVGTTSYQLHMIKTDANGSVGCNISTITPSQKTYTPPVAVIAPTVYTGGSGSNFTLSNTAVTPTVTIDCITCAKPNASVSASPTTICQGQSTTITATGGTSYSWSTGATSPTIVVSPAVTTIYTATVTAGGCDSIPPPITITVNPQPAASISGNTNICTGQSTTLTASGGGTYSWWNNGASSATITDTPAGTTNYTVTVTSATGCTNTAVTTVTVNSTPTASISGSTAICAGDAATLTASGGSSYSWWNNGAASATITDSPTSNTTYTVTVSNGSCSSTTSTSVTVNPLPAASISGNTNICQGSFTTLTASGGGTYLWDNTATTVSITVNPATTTSYTVTVTGGNGCTAVAVTTVNVAPPPVATVSGNNTICAGQSTALTASGGLTYSWNTTATTSSITVSPAISTTYSVIVSAGTCSDTTSISVTVNASPTANITGSSAICSGQNSTLTASGGGTYSWSTGVTTNPIIVSPTIATSYSVVVSNGLCSDTATVNVTVNSPVTASISSSSTTICSGTTATLSASGGTSYSWSTGVTTNPIIVSPSTGTTYSVIVSNGTCSDTATATISVNPSPVVTVSASSNAICMGQSATLTASGGGTYAWNTGATSNVVTVTPTSTTNYTVVVTAANGCTASATSSVTVTPVPVATINSNSTICSGDMITLTAGGGTTYLWSPGNQTTSTIQVNPAISTTYTVTVTNGNCTDTASTIVFVNPSPTASAGANVTINYGDATTLTASGGGTYSWSTGENSQSISVNPPVTTTYTVVVTDANGCTDIAVVTVYIEFNCGNIFIPNAFSPNGDGKNDYFVPRNICFKTFHLVIYDRWGVKVFVTDDIATKGWDGMYKGSIGETAVFNYYFSYELVDGNSDVIKGTVSLIR